MNYENAAKKKDKQKKEKPEYNMWQNSVFILRDTWRWDKGLLFWLLFGAVIACLSSVAELYLPKTVIAEIENKAGVGRMATIIVIYTAVLMLLNALHSLPRYKNNLKKIKIRANYSRMISVKRLTTDYENLDDPNFGVICKKARETTNSNNSACEAVFDTFAKLLTNAALFVFFMILLKNVSVFVLAVSALSTVAGYFINKSIDGWTYAHKKEYDPYSAKLRYIVDTARNDVAAKDIRLYGMKGWLSELYQTFTGACVRFRRREEKMRFWGDAAKLLLTLLRNGVAYAYLISLVLNHGMRVSDFVLYFAAAGSFTGYLSGMLSQLESLNKQSIKLCYLRQCLDYPEKFKREGGIPIEPVKDCAYEIELKDVSFRYPKAETDTIKGISLKIPAGEKLAVVGLNGAGKTTLVKLICGFYDPAGGEVLLNGKNIKEYNRLDYYGLFTAVFQDFSILPVTLAENIAQERPGALDIERAKRCAALAGISEKIESLPQGYSSNWTKDIHENGIRLSGGETQKMMLARALYKDAPVIILDEPTAALDPIAEAALYGRYNELTAGRLSVYISHRLASTRFCDRIVMLEDGRIIEDGTHDELISKNGKYADLYEVQSHYYRERDKN